MEFLDQLRAMRYSPKSIWIQFSYVYVENSEDVYIFVEGGDDVIFYAAMLRQLAPGRKVYDFDCRNKTGVLAARDELAKRGGKRCLFFVDKDHDDIIGLQLSSAGVFETEGYSIETYLCSIDIIESLWREILGLDLADPRLEHIRIQYGLSEGIFYQQMRPYMAWLVWHRRRGNNPSIRGIKPESILKFGPNSTTVFFRGRIAELSQRAGVDGCQNPTAREILAVSRELAALDPQKYVRGKEHLWFFLEFLRVTAHALERDKGTRRSLPNYGALPHKGNAISTLAPRLVAPRKLREYVAAQLAM